MNTAIFTVVEVINGIPAITNYKEKSNALKAFEEIVREQFDDDVNEDFIKEAIESQFFDDDCGYRVEMQVTDLK